MLLSAMIGWVRTELIHRHLARQSDRVLADMGLARDDLRRQISAPRRHTEAGRAPTARSIRESPDLLSMLHPIAARIREARCASC